MPNYYGVTRCDYFMWFVFRAMVVLTGFVMCVYVLFFMCGCFGNMCTCTG